MHTSLRLSGAVVFALIFNEHVCMKRLSLLEHIVDKNTVSPPQPCDSQKRKAVEVYFQLKDPL